MQPQPPCERAEIPPGKTDSALFRPLADMNQFVGQERTVSLLVDVMGQQDGVAEGHAVVAAGQRRYRHHAHVPGQILREHVVGVELGLVQ